MPKAMARKTTFWPHPIRTRTSVRGTSVAIRNVAACGHHLAEERAHTPEGARSVYPEGDESPAPGGNPALPAKADPDVIEEVAVFGSGLWTRSDMLAITSAGLGESSDLSGGPLRLCRGYRSATRAASRTANLGSTQGQGDTFRGT